MLDRHNEMTPELALLLACSRIRFDEGQKHAIRDALEAGVDWIAFATKAVNHGIAGLVGRNLVEIAQDLVPDEILDAFSDNLKSTRKKNECLLDELVRIFEALAAQKIKAIPLKGPVLAIEAFRDVGLRVFRDLDFLIRDRDLHGTIAVLRDLGFVRRERMSEAQAILVHRLQGQICRQQVTARRTAYPPADQNGTRH